MLQAAWRGFICRLKIKRSKQSRMILKIQCIARCLIAKRKFIRRKRQKNAITIISSRLKTYIVHKRYERLKRQEKQVGPMVRIIQRLVRRYFGRKLRYSLLSYKRVRKEHLEMSTNRLNSILLRVQLKLIIESLSRPITARTKSACLNECLCNGPVQALFVLGAVHRGKSEQNSLLLNRLEKSTLLKFAAAIEGLMKDGKQIPPPPPSEMIRTSSKYNLIKSPPISGGSRLPESPSSLSMDTAGITPSPKRSGKKKLNGRQKKATAIKCLLFANIRNRSIQFPSSQSKLLTPTDVDIIFTKSRSQGTASKGLSYSEFLSCIKNFAEQLYDSSPQQSSVSFSESIPTDGFQSNIDVVETDQIVTEEFEEDLPFQTEDAASVASWSSAATIRYPIERVSTNFFLSLILRCLVSFEQADWMKQVGEWLTN